MTKHTYYIITKPSCVFFFQPVFERNQQKHTIIKLSIYTLNLANSALLKKKSLLIALNISSLDNYPSRKTKDQNKLIKAFFFFFILK